jgi:hypothetical protein
VQRVNDIGGQTFVEKEPEDVVTVVSGSLKPYFYVVCRPGAGTNPLQQCLETVPVVGNGEYIGQNLIFRTEDKAVVLVLRHINSNANHDDTSRVKIYDAVSTEHFAL